MVASSLEICLNQAEPEFEPVPGPSRPFFKMPTMKSKAKALRRILDEFHSLLGKDFCTFEPETQGGVAKRLLSHFKFFVNDDMQFEIKDEKVSVRNLRFFGSPDLHDIGHQLKEAEVLMDSRQWRKLFELMKANLHYFNVEEMSANAENISSAVDHMEHVLEVHYDERVTSTFILVKNCDTGKVLRSLLESIGYSAGWARSDDDLAMFHKLIANVLISTPEMNTSFEHDFVDLAMQFHGEEVDVTRVRPQRIMLFNDVDWDL